MRGAGEWTIEVCVLGRLQVRVDGRPVALTSDRLRALLVTLAMRANQAVSVERLIDAAWGSGLPKDPRRTLQTYVHRLRRALGENAITTEPEGYALRTDTNRVDALRFTRLLDRANRDPRTERATLIEALLLWRGDPFEGIDTSWLVENEAIRLRERYLKALERRVDLDLSDGRHAEVVAELEAIVAEHPLREPLWARLLRALSGSGRRAEALNRYASLRRRIADDFGVEPSAELQAIHAVILAGDHERPLARVPQAARAVPRQLPVDLPGFTGRTDSLDVLDAALDNSSGGRIAIVAVHGSGGVGKTSLVVHWAHRAAEWFPDGQLYLNLRGYGPGAAVTPISALGGMLRDLGVDGARVPSTESARGGLLRTLLAERRLLVILDNARDAEQIRPLLPGSGGSMVIVTSRSQLRDLVAREGATRLTLEQLTPKESNTLLADSLQRAGIAYDAAQLPVLADRCGHVPLALAIAAERATREPKADLAALIDELGDEHVRLDVCDSGEHSAAQRPV